jgi:hypothetical protein
MQAHEKVCGFQFDWTYLIKRRMAARKLVARVMDLHEVGKSGFWTILMQIVWIRLGLDYFMH